MDVDPTAVARTRQKLNAGIWVCAAFTMTASIISGITTFYHLQHDGWGIASGLLTAVAVDTALWVVLTGDHQLERIGLMAGPWSRVMRYGTALASVFLNIGAAVLMDLPQGEKLLLVIAHIIIPLLLVGMSEYNSECAAKFTKAEDAARKLLERSTTPPPAKTSDLQYLLEPQSQVPMVTALPFTPTVSTPPVARPCPDQPKQDFPRIPQRPDQHKRLSTTQAARPPRKVATLPAAGRGTPVRDEIFSWLDKHHGSSTTATTVADATGISPHTCKKYLGEWRKDNQAKSKLEEAVS